MNGTCFACVKIERLFQADGPVTPPLWGQRGDAKQHRLCLSSLPPIGSVPYTLSPPPPTLSPFCISVNNCLQHLLNSLFFLVVFFCHVQLKQQEIGASNQYKKRERMLEANRELPNLLLLLLGYWNIKCFHKAKSDKPASFFMTCWAYLKDKSQTPEA